jgi:hypothetical protein
MQGVEGAILLKADDFSHMFWELLRQAGGDPDQLERILRQVPREVIEEYYHEFNRAVANLWDSGVPDYFGDHSEDTQKEIMEHTVGQGKEFYTAVLAHPEQAPIGEHIGAPAFRGAALFVYRERFGQDIPE